MWTDGSAPGLFSFWQEAGRVTVHGGWSEPPLFRGAFPKQTLGDMNRLKAFAEATRAENHHPLPGD